MISQEFFDDVCHENADLLDLSPDDAVQETVQQLGVDKCTYLVQTFPSDSCSERISRRDFVTRLERLNLTAVVAAACTAANDPDRPSNELDTRTLQQQEGDSPLVNDLQITQKRLEEDFPVYSRLLEANEGVKRLSQFLSDYVDVTLQQQALTTLLAALQKPSLPLLQQLQDQSIQLAIVKWFKSAWIKATDNELVDGCFSRELIALAYYSCKGNQFVKHLWMQDVQEPKLANLLVDALANQSDDSPLVTAASRFMACLCTFDDSSSKANSNDPSIATAHAHVQAFHATGALDALKKVLFLEHDIVCCTTIIQALRSLAVHNDIVQTVVANGTLQRIVTLFYAAVERLEQEKLALSNAFHAEGADSGADDLAFAAACLGLFRNVCANDDIKYTLCAGSMSVVGPMAKCMQLGITQPTLQTHACGTIAAMALRQPHNAAFLVDAQVAPQVEQAMRRYPDRSNLQRQGCLAIRNLASRAEPTQKKELLALTRDVLQGVAAKHLECQDEVYAALRDMGIDQAHVFAVQDADTGVVTLKERQAFGRGHNANFRAVYE